MKAILVLEDGKSFQGESVLAGERFGELILNTAVVGYQEILTDPANAGKILVFTYPLIGNYGVAPKFNESDKVWVSGLVIKELSRTYSNWQAKGSLEDFLKIQNSLAIYNLDTRTLAVRLREKGPLSAMISTSELDPKRLLEKLDEIKKQPAQTFLPDLSVKKQKVLGRGKKIVVLDLGVTASLLKQLEGSGFSVNILPYNTTAKQILSLKPKGVVISNGPENDPGLVEVAENLKPLIGKLPILGVVTGWQVLATALGVKLTRLKLGHRGVNYPLARPGTFKGEITSQNHGYVIEYDALREIKEIKVTAYNLNDHTVEEVESKKLKLIGVQYNLVTAGFGQSNPILNKFNKMLSTRAN